MIQRSINMWKHCLMSTMDWTNKGSHLVLCFFSWSCYLFRSDNIGNSIHQLCKLSSSQQALPDFVFKAIDMPPGLFLDSGQQWKRARQILSPAFSVMKLKMVRIIKPLLALHDYENFCTGLYKLFVTIVYVLLNLEYHFSRSGLTFGMKYTCMHLNLATPILKVLNHNSWLSFV